MVALPFSLTSIKSIFLRGFYLVALLYRKNVVKAAAVYTTFSGTINKVFLAVAGNVSWMKVGSVFLSEGYTKFLGAAPNLLKGVRSLNELQLVDAAWFLWQGVAALIMMFFIYSMLFGKGMTREIEWPEKVLVLGLWLSISSQVHGSELVLSLFDQVGMLFEGVEGVLPDFSGNGSVNGTGNLSVNSTN